MKISQFLKQGRAFLESLSNKFCECPSWFFLKQSTIFAGAHYASHMKKWEMKNENWYFSSIVAFTIIFLHHQRWIVLRRTFLLGAIMYGLRAVILGVTFLPPSFNNRDEICQPQVNRTAMYGMEIATRYFLNLIICPYFWTKIFDICHNAWPNFWTRKNSVWRFDVQWTHSSSHNNVFCATPVHTKRIGIAKVRFVKILF